MTLISTVFDAYIDANILMIFAFLLWVVARFLLVRLGMPHAYAMQLRLLNGIFLAVAVSPFFALGIGMILQSGLVAPGYSPNLSDFVVAQYLNGSFEMKPSQLEKFLGLRDMWTGHLLELQTTGGVIVAAGLAMGFVVVLVRMAVSVVRLRRIIDNSFAWRRFGRIQLRLSDRTQVPFSTRSWRHHYIVIPSGMLAQSDDLRMAIGHEFQHLRQGDIEWEIVLEFLKPLFFWNPAFLFWKRQVDHLRELSCDQQVLSRKRYDVQAYCECLLRVCHDSLRKDRRLHIIVPTVAFVQMDRSLFAANSVRFLRYRVTSLFEAKPDQQHNQIIRVVRWPLLLIVVFASVAIQEPSDWSQDRLMLSAIVNLERLEARNVSK